MSLYSTCLESAQHNLLPVACSVSIAGREIRSQILKHIVSLVGTNSIDSSRYLTAFQISYFVGVGESGVLYSPHMSFYLDSTDVAST